MSPVYKLMGSVLMYYMPLERTEAVPSENRYYFSIGIRIDSLAKMKSSFFLDCLSGKRSRSCER